MAVSFIEVNETALLHDLKAVREYIPKEVKAFAVAEADGYSHGAVRTVELALSCGYAGAAVARVQEAEELREAGISCPVYLLGVPLPTETEDVLRLDLIFPVDDTVDLDTLEKEAAAAGKTARVMLAVDAEISRVRLRGRDIRGFLQKLKQYPHISLRGAVAHRVTSDSAESSGSLPKRDIFNRKSEELAEENFFLSAVQGETEAGCLYDLPRPGVILYGIHESKKAKEKLGLIPAIRFISHVTHVQLLRKGEFVGYGATYTADRDMKIATVAIGYADGYPRSLSNKGCVLIGGKRCPIVGRICMDQFMVAVDEDTKEGDEAVLIGTQGEESLPIEEVAETAGTIPEELLCGLKRISRTYVSRVREIGEDSPVPSMKG